MSSQKPLGVTAPISESLPTEAEKRFSDALIEELRRQKTFESPSDTELRHKVLASLQAICDEFVKKVAREKDPENDFIIRTARGKIFTYGSFRLGVFGPGSDIDTLVVAPKYVTRDDYFKHFPGLLQSMAPAGAITDLSVVEDAFVPIIKFEYHGISIDLIFSRVIQKQITPDLDLKDTKYLRGLDEQELRSLNGTRVTDEILSLVPEQSTFKLALRTIKLWAQRRAVYANIVGFPGGVAWAMLVARVCQLYPKATVSVIVMKFFKIYTEWQWPQPVLLKPVEDGPLPVRVWNPKVYHNNRYDLMPVITPAYPSMCATFNITKSTKDIILAEIERGLGLTLEIMSGKRPWSDLFAKHTFFTKDYKYYMTVVSAGKSAEQQKIWSGWIESRVRLLVGKLERADDIVHARPFVKSFERRHICHNDEELRLVQEGSLDFMVSLNKENGESSTVKAENGAPAGNNDFIKADKGTNGAEEKSQAPQPDPAVKVEDGADLKETSAVLEGLDEKASQVTEVFTTTQYIGLELVPVSEFQTMCKSWDRYEKELHDAVTLSLHPVRKAALPDDLFEPGEPRPRKKGAKKRLAAEDQPPPAKRQQSSNTVTG